MKLPGIRHPKKNNVDNEDRTANETSNEADQSRRTTQDKMIETADATMPAVMKQISMMQKHQFL